MDPLNFTKPGIPIDEYVIALEDHLEGFIAPPTQESHQKKITSYAQNSSGTVVAGIMADLKKDQLYLQGIWVNNAVRNKGIGKKLLLLLETYAVENNIYTINIETTHPQLTTFYIHQGYDIISSSKPNNPQCKQYYLKKCFFHNTEKDSLLLTME